MTDKYAVIGNPISHSKSPQIHRMFAEQTGQDISYEAILVPPGPDDFRLKILQLRKEGYKGCNVTVPFKQHAYQLDIDGVVHSEDVSNARAANTLIFLDGKIRVENTDGIGLVKDIEQNLKTDLRNKRLLLLGAGGAAMGVVQPLRHAGANITIANRTIETARALARPDMFGCGFEELAGKQFDVVINATSSGLSNEMPPLPLGIFAPGALAYDMMYGRETPFMAFARQHGARVADGLGMLVEQAAEAFFIWRGMRPDTRLVLEKLRAI